MENLSSNTQCNSGGLDLRDAYASENSLKHLLQRVDVLIESPLYIPDVPPFFKNSRTWHQ